MSILLFPREAGIDKSVFDACDIKRMDPRAAAPWPWKPVVE